MFTYFRPISLTFIRTLQRKSVVPIYWHDKWSKHLPDYAADEGVLMLLNGVPEESKYAEVVDITHLPALSKQEEEQLEWNAENPPWTPIRTFVELRTVEDEEGTKMRL